MNQKPRFDITKWQNTTEEAEIFCEYLDSAGMVWCNGESYVSDVAKHYKLHSGETCYNFNLGTYNSIASYSAIGCYTILHFSDFTWNDFILDDSNEFLDQFLRNYERREVMAVSSLQD